MLWTSYQKPTSLSETFNFLAEAEGRARIIAGGTDLMLQLKKQECRADVLVDITGIEELKQIRENGDWIQIGAAVTHAEVANSAVIQKEARCLAQGCLSVGSPQIRNTATLMGNIITAQPAADGLIPLTALDAEIKLVNREGERWIPLGEVCQGIGCTCVDSSHDLATEIRFKKPGAWGRSGFFRLSRRKSLALPMLNGAVVLHLNDAGKRIEKARIALGPVAERPFRPRKAEERLESGKISPELIDDAARLASEEANPRTSLIRGSNIYRKEMVQVFTARVIRELVEGL